MAEIGSIGGAVKSEAKAAAARLNAKRGGWPKGRPRTKLHPAANNAPQPNVCVTVADPVSAPTGVEISAPKPKKSGVYVPPERKNVSTSDFYV